MFGYVKPYRPELLVREDRYYGELYCGLCRAMKRTTGRLSSLSLSYDFVFWVLVRAIVDGTEFSLEGRRCIVHPLRRRPSVKQNETMTHAARLSASLIYYQLRDDLRDRGVRRKLRAVLLYPIFSRARRRAAIGDTEAEFRRSLDTLARLERERVPSVDLAADAFGQMLAAAFADGVKGKYAPLCREIGHRLGRFIYAADAAEDFEDDRRTGNYNPYVLAYGEAPLDRAVVMTALKLELTALERAIDLLPFGESGVKKSIIRNVLYYGLPERIKFLSDSDVGEKGENDGS